MKKSLITSGPDTLANGEDLDKCSIMRNFIKFNKNNL